jgi:hypothetical protein
MFGRRGKPAKPPVADAFVGLRRLILELDPATAGIKPSADLPHVWGVLMETGLDGASFTLVCLADGTTSLYFSTGGGLIGGGEHESVAAVTRILLEIAEQTLPELAASTETALPQRGRVVLRAMTYAGPQVAEAGVDELRLGAGPLSKLYDACHDVVTELRLVGESNSE